MTEQLAYKSLGYHARRLQESGFYRLDQRSSKKYQNIHNIYVVSVILFFVVYTIQQLLKIYEVRHNVDHVMGTMFLLLTYTDCIYKAVVLWKKSDNIQEVLDVMKGPSFNQKDLEHQEILLATVNSSRKIRIFNHMCLFTCFLWVLHPTILHIQGKTIDFPVWLPFDPNLDPYYYAALLYIWLQTSWLAYCNTVTDVFIVFFLEQCRTQITILRLNLENLVSKSREESIKSNDPYTQILDRRFKKMLKHHKEIVHMADKIQDIFGGAVFYQFLVGGWILCTSAYRMVNIEPATIEFFSMIMYVLCILIQIFLYCYYGSRLTDESEKLTESAYATNWLELPVSQRKHLITFMERIKRPISPMAGFIIPLSKSTYVSILRSSYSFYAFLKNSEK